MGKIIHVFMFCVIFVLGASKIIETPSVTMPGTIYIRMNEVGYFAIPDYPFQNIYNKSIAELKDSSQTPFNQCTVKDAFLGFPVENVYAYTTPNIKKPLVTVDINDIIYSDMILDSTVYNGKVFLMLVDGTLLALTLQSKNTFVINETSYKTDEQRLRQGYFVINNQQLCFANDDVMYCLDQTTNNFQKVENYLRVGKTEEEQFETIIAINEKYFAVAYSTVGVWIYSRNVTGNIAINEASISKSDLRLDSAARLAIKDIQFDNKRKILFILEQSRGLFAFSTKITDKTIQVSLLPEFVSLTNCDLMYLHNVHIYAVCQGLVKISIADWPKTKITNMPDSKMKPRDISENSKEKILFLQSRNVVQIIYNGVLTEYLQDHNMNKIIMLEDDRFISINNRYIYFGQYKIYPPKIVCQANNINDIGKHKLVITTQSECDENYLHQNDIKYTFTPQNIAMDTCLYTTYVDIEIWNAADVEFMPIILAMIFMLFTVWVMIMLWCVNKRQQTLLQRELLIYAQGGEGHGGNVASGGEGHIQLVQQAVEQKKDKKQAEQFYAIQ